MKKINLFLVIGIMAASVSLISSCNNDDDSTNTPTPTPTPTPLQIDADITRRISYDGITQIRYNVYITNSGWGVNNATVTVNSTNVPSYAYINYDGDTLLSGSYQIDEVTDPYIPGQDYTVSVQYNGKTYTETLKAPGGFTTNTEITTITWQQPGSICSIEVEHLYGSTTYYVPTGGAGPLTSPQSIPTSAYPSPGTYHIMVYAQNIKDNSFSSLSGINCRYDILDSRDWEIIK